MSPNPHSLFRSHWREGLAFLFGLILGPGALWHLLESRSAERNTNVQVMRLSLDSRGRLNDLLIELVRQSSLFQAIRDCDSSIAAYGVQGKLGEIQDRLELLENDILSIEGQLAKIEGRPPRDIILKSLRPGPPGPITIEQIPPSGEQIQVAGPTRPRPPCPKL